MGKDGDFGNDVPLLNRFFAEAACAPGYSLISSTRLRESQDVRKSLGIRPDDHRAYFFLGRDVWQNEKNKTIADRFQTKVALEPWMAGQDILKELTGEDDPASGEYQMLFIPGKTKAKGTGNLLFVMGQRLNLPEILEEKFGILPGTPIGKHPINAEPSNLAPL